MSKSLNEAAKRSAAKKLSKWFERESRVLPWREDASFYRVWISEIMLQQTQVATVLPYFDRFMNQFSTVDALARASDESVMKAWAGLGYYSRARNLHKAAKILSKSGFPKTREGWLEIPGVGPYTAGAILSIAGNQPEAILDGNIERVWCRLHCLSRDKDILWNHSREWIARAVSLKIEPRNFNQALMELGALVCTPKKPKCAICPVSSICEARIKNVIENYPPKKPKKKWVKVADPRACIVFSDLKMILNQDGEWRKGLWDFLIHDEKLLKRFSGLKKQGQISTRHVVTNHKISRETEVYFVNRPSTQIKLLKNERWVHLFDADLPTGSAFRKTLNKVQSLLAQIDERFAFD